MTSPRPARWAALAALLAGATILAAACGSAATPPPTAAPTAASTPAASAAASAKASGGAKGALDLAAFVAAEKVSLAVGQAVTAKCDTGVVFGGESCVWTSPSDSGVWLKVEHSTARETATLELYKARMKTLGYDKAVDGMGQAAFVGTFSSSVKIAVFIGEGRVLFVTVNKKGIDATAGTTLVTEIAKAVLARI